MAANDLLPPEITNIDPLESGIEFFEEQKKFTFLFKYQCNKVFLNHVDTYNGRHILRYLGSKEYTKYVPQDEVKGEEESIPTLREVAHIESANEGLGDEEKEGVDGAPFLPPPLENIVFPESEETHDSLFNILGGVLTKMQVDKLRSLPTKDLRAEYLKNVMKELEMEHELVAEECQEPSCYELVGTMKNCDDFVPEIMVCLKEKVTDLKAYLPMLLNCSTVIFDVSRDPSQIEEARWALRAMLCSFQYLNAKSNLCFREIKDVRKFILISSAMTWEMTDKMKIRKKPVKEDNIHLRKPHPLFKNQKHLEQEVMRAGQKFKNIFKTYVLASGIPYGLEEDRLKYLFDLGWNNEEELPLLGNGHNALPIIHIEDLAMLVFHCMTRVDTTPTYLFAAEKNPPTLLQITEALSRGMTTGKTHIYTMDDTLPDNLKLHEDTFAMLNAELLIEPSIHKLTLPWKYNMNMVNNMAAIIDEYIEYRNLCPFKILVSGPPSSGKTMLAKRLAEIYDVVYLNSVEVVGKYIEKLEREAAELKEMETSKTEKEEEGRDDEEETTAEEDKMDYIRPEGETDTKLSINNELDEIKHSMEVNGGVPEDAIVIRIVKKRIVEMDVVNHGYVLDGWPETDVQADGMFGKDIPEELPTPEMSEEEEDVEEPDDDEEEVFGEDHDVEPPIRRNINISLNCLIHLDCDCDDILFKYLAAKEDLERKFPSSIRFSERICKYKEIENLCGRAFDYFDNNCLDLKILRFNCSTDACPFLGQTLKRILNALGPPTNKGFVRRYLEEYTLIRKIQESERDLKLQERAGGIEKMDIEYFRAACQFMDKWVDFSDKNIKEKSDCEDLNDNILPESVVDCVVKALIEFKKTSPDDYLEFLAEFFLKEYENEKGHLNIPELLSDGAVLFRRCIASVLKHCEPSCLPLLPQAVDVIMKYRRLAAIKGSSFPKSSKDDIKSGSDQDKMSDGKETLSGDGQSSTRSVFMSSINEQTITSSKTLGGVSLSQLADLLIKTNPIWREKIRSDNAGQRLTISDESLKILLEQLRQLSCEIRYRLKKRGLMQFDDDSTIGSMGEWPRKSEDQECSGEIRPPQQQSPTPSLDTKRTLELIKQFVVDEDPMTVPLVTESDVLDKTDSSLKISGSSHSKSHDKTDDLEPSNSIHEQSKSNLEESNSNLEQSKSDVDEDIVSSPTDTVNKQSLEQISSNVE